MNSPTILPCPFCNHEDVEIGEVEPGTIAVDCPECQCIGPFADTVDGAIVLWNRPTSDLRRLIRHDSLMTESVLAYEKRIEQLLADKYSLMRGIA